MEVSTLLSQMQETLSTINTTIASLNTTEHDARLDELEHERDKHIQALHNAFSDESSAISQKRKAQRDEIEERRRKEDEERERKRRLEDEEFEAQARAEDDERDGDLREHTKEVEEKTDLLMAQVEEEAQRIIEEGRQRLKDLEGKRKELNRLIDEQLQMPLPLPTPRVRRSLRGGEVPPAVVTESKTTESLEAGQPMSYSVMKAHEDDSPRDDVHHAETLPTTTYSPEPAEISITVPDLTTPAHLEDEAWDADWDRQPSIANSFEEGEDHLSLAEMEPLSRCHSRDPSAEMHAQTAKAENEEAESTVEGAPEEGPVTRLRSASEEIAWWGQQQKLAMAGPPDIAEHAHEEEMEESVVQASEPVGEQPHEESAVAAEVPSFMEHNLSGQDNDLNSSDRGQYRATQVGTEASEPLDIQPDAESHKETSVGCSPLQESEYWPLTGENEEKHRTGEAQVAGEAGEPATEFPGGDTTATAPATLEQAGLASPRSPTDDNNMHTTSLSTPVAHIELLSKTLHSELDQLESSPVDLISQGSQFDEDNSFDSTHELSQSTSDIPPASIKEHGDSGYHDYQHSVSDHEHISPRPRSEELQHEEEDGDGMEEAGNIGGNSHLSPDHHVSTDEEEGEVSEPDAAMAPGAAVEESHSSSHLEEDDLVTRTSGDVQQENRDPAVRGYEVPTEATDELTELESVGGHNDSDCVGYHTEETATHPASEDQLSTDDDSEHAETEVDDYLQEKHAFEGTDGDNLESPVDFGGSASQEERQADRHADDRSDVDDSREDSPFATAHTEVEIHPTGHTNNDHGVMNHEAGGYFSHVTNQEEPTHSEQEAECGNTGSLMPLPTAYTDAESDGFFTPLASAETISLGTPSEHPTEVDHQDDTAHQEEAVDKTMVDDELHKTSSNQDGSVDEQDSSNGYESSQHKFELEDAYSTTVRGQDYLFDDDDGGRSDDSTENKHVNPMDAKDNNNPLDQGHGSEDDMQYSDVMFDSDAHHDNHYGDGPETPVVANEMSDTASDTRGLETQGQSWAEEAENRAQIEQLGENLPLDTTSDAGHHWDQDDDMEPGQEQATETPTINTHNATDLDQAQDQPAHILPVGNKGLAASRHNSERPQTPEDAAHPPKPETSPLDMSPEEGESSTPRDVTNTFWHSRNESTPMSLHSGSTLSSAPSSPVHAALLNDNHEPVIRDSWPPHPNSSSPFRSFGSNSIMGRSRGDSGLSDYSTNHMPENGGNGNNGKLAPGPMRLSLWQREEESQQQNGRPQRPSSAVDISNTPPKEETGTADRNSIAVSGTGSSLFQRMRSVFEHGHGSNTGGQSEHNKTASLGSSPTIRSSGIFGKTNEHQDKPQGDRLVRPGDVAAAYATDYDGGGYDYRSYEEDDRSDVRQEHSSLLGGDGNHGGLSAASH